MPENAKTPEIRFAEFTDAWEHRKLGDIALIIMGQSPNSSNYTDNPDDHILVQGNADMKNGRVTPRVWTTQITKKGEKGDLILSIRAPVGDVGKTDFPVVLGRGVAAIRGNEFLYQSFLRMKQIGCWDKLCTGSTFDSINSNDIRESRITVPAVNSKPESVSFASLDRLIALHQREHDKTVNIKKAMLEKMFPKDGADKPEIRFAGFTDAWEERAVFELADRYDNLRTPITASDRVPGSTPYYGANGIQDYVEGFTHDGEFILIAEDGANDLKNYPVQYINGKVWVNNHAHVLQSKQGIADNRFLMYAVQQTNIEPFLVGGGRAKLNADVMMKIRFHVPALKEQVQIGQLIIAMSDLITLHRRELEKLQNMKSALLEKMFV